MTVQKMPKPVLPVGDRFQNAMFFRQIGSGQGQTLYECWGDAIDAYAERCIQYGRRNNEWKDAVLDLLAVNCVDVPVETSAADTLKAALAAHDLTLLDPQVSSDAQALIDRGRQQALTWDEKSDKWSDAISASHPLTTKAYDAYNTAMEMVGNRKTKGSLVDLVCWLIQGKEAARQQMREECIAAVENERLTDENLLGEDLAYELALDHVTTAIKEIR